MSRNILSYHSSRIFVRNMLFALDNFPKIIFPKTFRKKKIKHEERSFSSEHFSHKIFKNILMRNKNSFSIENIQPQFLIQSKYFKTKGWSLFLPS